ncbi:hypothetical protein FC70_GL001159 [Paucilactobacillus oligofermentans DSM 15707 = LMG 22743]|uniref:HTH cro/C1-type domain-containing protein n=1 Tax=Paucilactobacillus oligofermentans DSM 15707 = LMG 22743 TaxID=1423778 RepID=A0A0R1RFI9_9LACO|nr:LBP_cg2779 family protein [Paucilactobacillus oligofermentans]KRL55558.1 hypothetical protein FC70_GL001159 [Paucilactobacillus oligofermentans DSM 15707 = LMG 22743]CUS25454.1 Uncharacterized protein LACOL_0146 [Paucilactobacillus oligofermentans DSM 15707 = LMG 22743]
MSNELSDFAEQIIQFEKKKHLADNDIAFSTQISVEQIHNIKSMKTQPTKDEVNALTKFMRNYK